MKCRVFIMLTYGLHGLFEGTRKHDDGGGCRQNVGNGFRHKHGRGFIHKEVWKNVNQWNQQDNLP